MQELTLKQAYDMSGIYNTDTDIEKDSKFSSWIGRRKYRVALQGDVAQAREKAIADGVEIFIIKES